MAHRSIYLTNNVVVGIWLIIRLIEFDEEHRNQSNSSVNQGCWGMHGNHDLYSDLRRAFAPNRTRIIVTVAAIRRQHGLPLVESRAVIIRRRQRFDILSRNSFQNIIIGSTLTLMITVSCVLKDIQSDSFLC